MCSASDRLLVVSDYCQDPLGTWYLHLEVGVVGDCHEFVQSRPAKQCMVGALEVHHFKPNWLSAEMILVSKEDVNLGLADW